MTIQSSVISNWKPTSEHVDQTIDDGVTTSSSHILMAVGPARYKELATGGKSDNILASIGNSITGGGQRKPIIGLGVMGSAVVTYNTPTKIVHEIGSTLQYHVPTVASGSISLSRIFLNGSSLMKALYGQKLDEAADLPPSDSPGYNELWLNMASSLFRKPIGIMLWFKNNKGENVGAFYYENCSCQGLSFSLYAAGGAFSEGTQIIFDKNRAVKVHKR